MQAMNEHPENQLNEGIHLYVVTTNNAMHHACGQPCGPSGTRFANFIGTLVRTKGFPIAHDDWRKVCPRKKYKLWTDAQVVKLVANLPSAVM